MLANAEYRRIGSFRNGERVVMDRDELRMRTVRGLRWLEGEVRELADIAGFRTEGERKLFKIQFERVKNQISEFEKDLIDLLVCYPEARDTAPLSRLLEERAVMRDPAPRHDASRVPSPLVAAELERKDARLARLHAELDALDSELKNAPMDAQPALRKRIADTERAIREAGG
jgi:hypothetical protein